MTRLFRELTLQDLRQDVLGTALPPPKDYYMNLALVLSSPEDMTGPASFRLADFGTCQSLLPSIIQLQTNE